MGIMILITFTAIVAVCTADKLDRSYLPPISAKTAGGSPGALQAPFAALKSPFAASNTFEAFPAGSYSNDALGVVVDAANPGTRTTGDEPTGLGAPRTNYGSPNSKVGDAAFSGSLTGFGTGLVGAGLNANGAVKFESDVRPNKYSFEYETDKIAVAEDGVDAGGNKAQGGYAYEGDDGQVYKVTYTADKDGYKPEGNHLPTPPPIPQEIVQSLEQNAKEEAAGIVDDGSYDAQKYNTESDTDTNKENDATSSNAFVTNGFKSVSSHGQASGSGHYGSSQNTFSSSHFGSHHGSYAPIGAFAIGAIKGQLNKEQSNSASSSALITGSGSDFPTRNPTGVGKFELSGSSSGSTFSQGTVPTLASPSLPSSTANIKNEFNTQTGLNQFPSTFGAAALESKPTFGSPEQQNTFSSAFSASQNQAQSAFPITSQTQVNAGLSNVEGSISTVSEQNPTKVPATELTTPLESSKPGSEPVSNTPTPTQSSLLTQDSQNSLTPVSEEIKTDVQTPLTQTGSADSNVASSAQKPVLTQQQGPDSSYFYNQPSRAFISPSDSASTQFDSLSSQSIQSVNLLSNKPGFASKNPGFPSSVDSTGITQASASPFTSTTTGTFGSQFNSKITSQSVQSSSNQFGTGAANDKTSNSQQYQGTIYEYNKPAQSLPAPDNSRPTSDQKDSQTNPSKISTTTFGAQTTSGQVKPTFGSFQQTQSSQSAFGSKPTSTQFSHGSSTFNSAQKNQNSFSKPTFSYTQSQYQFNQKPFGKFESSSQQTQSQFGSFTQKPAIQGSSFSSFSQTSQFGKKPESTFGSSFGSSQSTTGTQFGLKPQGEKEQAVSSGQTSSSTSFQQAQVSTNAFGNQKPEISVFGAGKDQTVNTQEQKPFEFGQSTGSSVGATQTTGQFGQKSQGSIFGSSKGPSGQLSQVSSKGQVSSTGSTFGKPQYVSSTLNFNQNKYGQSQFGQDKPFGVFQSGSKFQQTQFSSFENKPQTTFGQYQFTKGPFASKSQSSAQQTTFGSSQVKPSQSQFGQLSFGSSQTGSSAPISGSKPGTAQGKPSQTFGQNTFGSSQTGSAQFGSIATTFDTKTENNLAGQNTGVGSTTQGKPGQTGSYSQFGSTFGAKPETTQGSAFQQTSFGTTSFGAKPSQSQFGQFSFGGSQTGSSSPSSGIKPGTAEGKPSQTFGQNTFGSSQTGSAQFGSTTTTFDSKTENNLASQNTGLGSTTQGKPGQTGSYSQFGSTFGAKPEITQGSAFQQTSFGTTTSGAKPSQLASNSQFGSTTTKFDSKTENTQISQNTGFGSTTSQDKPSQSGSYSQFGSSSKFDAKPAQGSTFQQSSFETVSGGKPSKFATNSRFGFGAAQNTNTQQSNLGSSNTEAKPTQSGSYSQFGSTTTLGTFGAKPDFTQGPNLATQDKGFQQSGLSTTSQSKPAQSGSYFFGSTATSSDTKPVNTQTLTNQQTGFGSIYSQVKPSQSTFGQNTFGSQAGSYSQFGSNTFGKPELTQGSTFNFDASKNFADSSSASQATSKPQTSFSSGLFSSSSNAGTKHPKTPFESTFQQSTFGSSSKQEGQFGFGSSQAKPQTKPESTQQSSFGTFASQNKPSQTFGQNTFGPNYQFGSSSKTETTQGSTALSGFGSTNSNKPSQSGSYSFGTTDSKLTSKPGQGSSFQQSTFQSLQNKPTQSNFGSSQTSSQFGSTSTTFGAKPEATYGSNFQASFGSNQGKPSQTLFGENTFSQSVSTGVKPQTTQESFGQSSFGVSNEKDVSHSESGSSFGGLFENKDKKPLSQDTSAAGISGSVQKPFGSFQTGKKTQTQSSFGSISQTNKPFGSSQFNSQFASTQFNSKPSSFGLGTGTHFPKFQYSTTSPTFQTQKPFGQSVTSSYQSKYTQSSSSQFGLKPTQNSQTSLGFGQFGTQNAFGAYKPIKSAFQQTQFSVQGQKPFGALDSAKDSSSSSQSSLQIDQKTPESAIPSQSQSSFGVTGSSSGYNYQKPESTFGTSSGLSQNLFQPALKQTVTVSTEKPLSGIGSPFPSLFGVQSTKISSQFPSVSVSKPSGLPSDSAVQQTVNTFETSQASQPSGSLLSTGDSSVATTVNTPGTFTIPLIPVSSIAKGPLEEFGGPREPPKYDDKTGYQY